MTTDSHSIAAAILAAYDNQRQITPISDGDPAFGLDAAYRISDAVMSARIARGERPIGWKIGFTNRTIWDEYGVHAPIWGPVYDTTLHFIDGARDTVHLDATAFVEPRIEPEIVFRFAQTPRPDMDERELLGCIDAIAHGFEIVQSIYRDWRFAPADTAAAFAMHGALVCGKLAPVAGTDPDRWIDALATVEIALLRDGGEVDRGVGANVLDSPLSALRHFVAGMASCPISRGIEAGDLVTTGTVTRAFPVRNGESWATAIDGLPLPPLNIAFASAS